MKKQSADIYVTPIGHIILIPSQPVFAFLLNAAYMYLVKKQQNEYQFHRSLKPTIQGRIQDFKLGGAHLK